jgi:hypothetical protein
MKQVILSNWNFMRFLRLGLGIFIIVQSVIVKDLTMGVLGILFTIMPIFNIGCCGVGGCATVPPKRSTETTKDITYEEVV